MQNPVPARQDHVAFGNIVSTFKQMLATVLDQINQLLPGLNLSVNALGEFVDEVNEELLEANEEQLQQRPTPAFAEYIEGAVSQATPGAIQAVVICKYPNQSTYQAGLDLRMENGGLGVEGFHYYTPKAPR